ncbi:MAG: hypothetical protein M3Q52_07200 [Pseudomonadota bacterium]|nr:hypothetical protein [Pseudomonadota bacterium]
MVALALIALLLALVALVAHRLMACPLFSLLHGCFDSWAHSSRHHDIAG